MNLGNFSLSLVVKNLEASRAFYSKLGFSLLEGDKSPQASPMFIGVKSIG